MVQHIVLLKWKPGVGDEAILAAFDEAKPLPNEIEGVESLNIGRARVAARHGYTHALIVRLRDEEALERYLGHPLRLAYIADHLQPLEEERIELSVPVDKTLSRDPRRDWEWGASIGMGPPLDD
jgi:Stress responsive A/B Barrel Domain